MKRPLILDLDFTLLHLEAESGAIEVPGRTRSAYISPRTVEVLARLQNSFDIVIATARSWDGAQWVVDGLGSRGVAVQDVVIEDGALLGKPAALSALEPHRDWEKLRGIFNDSHSAPPFEWQLDFKACLVARADDAITARNIMLHFENAANALNEDLRIFRDGRKVYVAGALADKRVGLQALLGSRLAGAAGIGDGLNDACWLPLVAQPSTLASAVPEIIELVQNYNGYVSPHIGHDGIIDALRSLKCVS